MNSILFLGTSRPTDMDECTGFTERCINRIAATTGLTLSCVVSDNTYSQLSENVLQLKVRKDLTAVLLESIVRRKIDTIISIHYPWIIDGEVICAVGGNAFNVHNGKLPDYKGWNMLSHMILNGESTATTTFHRMTTEVDMGDIAYEECIDITPTDTVKTLLQKLHEGVFQNLAKLLTAMVNGQEIPRKPICGEGKFYSKFGLDKLKRIDNPLDPDEVDRKCRAFDCPPYSPAYIEYAGVRYNVTYGQ